MRMKIKLLGAVALASLLGLGVLTQVGTAQAASASLTALDPDNDGTVDVPEAKAAAAKLFVKLDPDKDGTLDAKELTGRIDEAGLKAADPDNDGTLDQNEYDAVVVERFNAANPDNDGTLDDNELSTDAGKSFLLLVE
jgi:Ca2+-binding EF-hand superfamily protein